MLSLFLKKFITLRINQLGSNLDQKPASFSWKMGGVTNIISCSQ